MKTLRFQAVIAIGAAVGLSLAALISCTPADPAHDRVAQSPSGRHALHSEQLRVIMNRMGGDTVKQWPQEIESERAADAEHERQVRFDHARELAAALARAADQIPQALQGVELTDAERATFKANAGRLRTEAVELEAHARARDFQKMRSTLHDIRNTCNGCHGQFRELTGSVMLPPKAL